MKTVPFLIMLTAFTGAAWADDASRQLPASLRANHIEIDQKTGISRYRGKVAVTQGTLRVTADQATAEQQGDLLYRITAEGRPATFRDKPEGQGQLVEGEAQRVEYEALERKLHLTGNVVLRHGDDRLQAGEAHYNLNNQSVSARRLDGQRVTATLNPMRASMQENTP